MHWKKGNTCYFIANNQKVIQALVISTQGDFCTLKFPGGATRLRRSRLYLTPEEAARHIVDRPQPQRRRHDPYLYGH